VNEYARHQKRIEILCRWILDAKTPQAAVGRYESARESAAATPGDLRRLRIAKQLALTAIAHEAIFVAGSHKD
jgi:hypothetical protein